mmetsp:Transcript_3484/g.7912  ORF Transcript_3484/g.7912 Transcript_3484/m.7912 type:complete len:244 (+) Transcript_3484:250-981(+)
MWRTTILIFIIFKLDNDFLDTRNPAFQFPNGTLGDLGLVKTSSFRKDGHDVLALVKASFRSCTQSHDVTPRQSNQLASVILILDIVSLGINVESLDTGQNPTSILVGTSYLRSHLFSRSCCKSSSSPLDGQTITIIMLCLSRIFRRVGGPFRQALEKATNAGFLIDLQSFKMSGDGHGEFGRRGFGTDLDTMMINVTNQRQTTQFPKVQAYSPRIRTRVARFSCFALLTRSNRSGKSWRRHCY